MKVNKIISFGIIILMLFSLFTTVTLGEHQNIFDEEKTTTESDISDVSLQSDFSDGDGTESDPYQISNWTHLDNVRNNLTENFTLINDLDNTTDGYNDLASETANNESGWNPIGDSDNPFTGTFDGQNRSISNLFIDRIDEDNIALFKELNNGGVIENLNLLDVDVTGGDIESVAGLVGWSGYDGDGGTVKNCYVEGTINAEDIQYVGGLVGHASSPSVIRNSSADVDVTGDIEVGGLIGSSDATIINCHTEGSVVANTYYIGGLVGNNGGDINNSYSKADVSGETSQIGGFVGMNQGNILNSYATGDIFDSSTATEVGGLVGENNGEIYNSYSIGNIEGDDNVGLLVGENAWEIYDSFALEREGIDLIGTQDYEIYGRVTNATEDDMKNIDLYKSNDTSDLEGDYDNLSDPWNIDINWVDNEPSYPYHGNSWTIDQVSEVYFDVNITHPFEGDEFLENKNITIEYNVTNTGTENGTQDIEFFVDNTSISIEEDVFLEPDQYYNGSFNWTTESPYEERNLKVESNNTYDDVNITVLQYPYFTVNITSPEDGSRYLIGDNITVNYTVRNIGDVNDTQDMEFYVNDTFMESEESIHLTSNETYESSFDYVIDDDGECNLSVSSENESDEITVFVELSPLHTLSYQPFGEKVNSTQDLKIEFDQEMNMTSIEQSIEIYSPTTTYDMRDGWLKWVEDHILLNFRPDFLPYQSETEYTVLIDGSIAKDVEGDYFDGNQNGSEGGDFIWTFESEDIDPPKIVSVEPEGEDVDPESDIVIEFDQDVSKSSVCSAFKLITPDGDELAINDGSYSWPDNRTFVFNPDEDFDYSTQYYYAYYEVILTTQVQDVNGNNLQEEYSWTFKTEEKRESPLNFTINAILVMIPVFFVVFAFLIILSALMDKEEKDDSYVSIDDDEKSYDKEDKDGKY